MNEPALRPSSAWRLSLRELLVVVALLAAACVILKYASSPVTEIVVGASLVVCGVVTIYAFVGRGPSQAFAIGFAVIMIGFSMSYNLQGFGSTGGYGVAPAQELLTWLHTQMATKYEIDPTTYNRIGPYEPSDDQVATVLDIDNSLPPVPSPIYAPPVMAPQPVGPASPLVYVSSYPTRGEFLVVGNCLLSILLSYFGGKFAVWVYLRRLVREADSLDAA